MIIGMGSGCRPWLNVSCAPRCPCLVSILILRRRTLSDTRARDTICLIHSRAREREWRSSNNHGNQKSPGVTLRTSDRERLQRQVLIWNNNLP